MKREDLIKKVASFLEGAAHDAIADSQTKNGPSATFYLNITEYISVVVAWIDGFEPEENNPYIWKTYGLEVSVRLRDSSYFVDDWDYVNEGCFCSLYKEDEEDGFKTTAQWVVDIMYACHYLNPSVIVILPGNRKVDLLEDGQWVAQNDRVRGNRYDLTQEWWHYHGWNRDSESRKKLQVWASELANYYGMDDEELQAEIPYGELKQLILNALLMED